MNNLIMNETRKKNRDRYHIGVVNQLTYHSTPLTDIAKMRNSILDDYYQPRAELKRFLSVDKGRIFNRLGEFESSKQTFSSDM